jgi:lipid II:glycine glycyltransferase (peptidoglycan interpeptide bridge formation enzyme)
MNCKEHYKIFCKNESSIPVFSEPWWLDAVCGEDKWDVALSMNKDNEIEAFMPYYLPGLDRICMPALTQTMGPWIRQGYGSYSKEISRKQHLMKDLIKQLPEFLTFSQNFHYSITDWLPFYWEGFEQVTHYSYVLQDISNLEKIFAGFERSKRKNIQKSKKIVKIKWDISADDFFENHKFTLGKQKTKISYTKDYFSKIYTASYENKQGRTLYAIDSEENIHAAIFIIWNKNSAYYLISTIDPDFRNSGASTLLVWEAIQFVSNMGVLKFDFEGSMIANVESSFRKFGGQQMPYFMISKDNRNIPTKAAWFVGRNIVKLLKLKI